MKTIILAVLALPTVLLPSFAQPDMLWSRTYGGLWEDYAYFVELPPNGGCVIGGHAQFPDAGGQDFWLLRTNDAGDTLWSRRFGSSSPEYCWAGARTSDGGWNFWLVKTSANGTSQWSRAYGGVGTDAAQAVCQTSDGGYLLAGRTESFGNGHSGAPDFWVVRTNANGDSLWSRAFGGTGWDEARSVVETDDGGCVVAGASGTAACLIKISAEGDSMWGKRLGRPLRCVRRTEDGGFVLAGNSLGDYWLAKTDTAGDTLWSRTFGGPEYDLAFTVEETADGGYVLAGMTQSFGYGQLNSGDFWLVRASPDGDSLWSCTFGGTEDDVATALQLLPDGGYLVAGYTNSYGAGGSDFWLVRTGPDPMSVGNHFVVRPSCFSLSSYPNPFNASTTILYDLRRAEFISLCVFDPLGRQVAVLKDGFAQAGNHRVLLDGSTLPSGVYFARLDAGGFAEAQKLVLLK